MKKFVVGLLLMVIIVDMFCPSEAWLRRRRRRRTQRCNILAKHNGWDNHFDGDLKFKCPAGEAIRNFQSTYLGCAKDRAFGFHCSSNKYTKKMGSCSWSSYANSWDQPLVYTCPNHGVLAGVESVHHNHYEDRRFKFYCCHSRLYHANFCKTSGYVNDWRSNMNFWAPWNRFIVGAISFHTNSQEDRRWRFKYCQVY
ncbi:hemagglutinin/amebocyte aggregation factor [Exaiptasia diaphana]|uniref:Dermatopontin n=1 Tax=Exaiptasia diaphana TaxID=2652724 RepID=A0A913WYI1_EXADI|nr:hemagglutinin/amebocyte aggregation factor [Exaiptasia diaphana]